VLGRAPLTLVRALPHPKSCNAFDKCLVSSINGYTELYMLHLPCVAMSLVHLTIAAADTSGVQVGLPLPALIAASGYVGVGQALGPDHPTPNCGARVSGFKDKTNPFHHHHHHHHHVLKENCIYLPCQSW